ncbi:MAG: SGNH/GDSL hydrolase family protein [Armatimonadota bacterium]
MTFLKHMMIVAALGLTVTASSASADTFKSGDRWCAVGDSITHGGTYHQFIYLYHATRFPERDIMTYNCGIGGDNAAGVLKRMPWDVINHKPTVASVMLGMNDVNIFAYGPDKTDPEFVKLRQTAIETYKTNMRKLAEEFKAAGVRMIFIMPSIYDQTSTIETPVYFGGNDGLVILSQYVKELAKEFKGSLVDFNGPMARINVEQQKTNPKFALAGPDRVHPGDVGHMTMAYLFLKAQEAPKYVSYMDIDASQYAVIRKTNCSISKLKIKNDEISFTALEKALPFPVSDGAKPALDLVPFTNDFNQEILKVTGLKSGQYSLSIDGSTIGKYDATELGKGINLAILTNTPQYHQAIQVALANQKRQDISVNALRNIAIIEYLYCPNRADGPVKLEDIRPTLEKVMKDAKDTPAAYMIDMLSTYIKNKPNEEQLNRDVEAAAVEMRRLAKPQSHKFVIRREIQ